MKLKWIAVLTFVALLASARAEEKVAGVEFKDYKGWPNSAQLSAVDQPISVVVVGDVGGRVLHYGAPDANIIFENDSTNGKTLKNTTGHFWVGGYQCDIGPEIRGLPNHPQLWMGEYQMKATAPYTLTATSVEDAASGMQLRKEITLDPKTGAVNLVQHMKNISDKESNYSLWDRTLCKGGGFAFMRLNKKSRFPAGWTLRLKERDPGAYSAAADISLPNVKIIDGVLVTECNGKYGKLGTDTDAGWIAYARGKQLYIKTFKYFPDGNYTDGGSCVELYWSDRVAELEPMSPEIKLKPGEEYTFKEKWLLLTLPEEIKTFEQAAGLAGMVDKAVAPLKEEK